MNILIHGFNVRDPEKSIGKLKPYLGGSLMFNYGWFELLSVLFKNKKEARKLKKLLGSNLPPKGRTIWAHSNGCAIAVEAARQGANIETLICINPALKCNTEFPDSIGRVLVIYTRHDKPTRAARFFDKVPFIQILIPNAWGAMGAKGYSGNDKRVKNWNLSELLEGHSDFFKKENLDWSMPKLERWHVLSIK